MPIKQLTVVIIFLLLSPFVNSKTAQQLLIDDLYYLADQQLAGRKTGSQSAELTRSYIKHRLSQVNNNVVEQPFCYKSGLFSQACGINIISSNIGALEAVTQASDPLQKATRIIITAHYDHLGKRGGKLHPGANDNATGVAALIYLASVFNDKPLPFSLTFVATDAEENGLHGSKYFAKTLLPNSVIMNINLDMLGVKKRRSNLYVLTSRSLKNTLNSVFLAVKNNNVNLKPVYSAAQMSRYIKSKNINWHKASDHYSFARQKIPYVYFGMGYDSAHHTSNDTAENINSKLFTDAVLLIEAFINQLAKTPLPLSPS